jgi:diaminopropionate ammonia-lyase
MLPPSLPIRFLLNPGADISRPFGSTQARILNRAAHTLAFEQISQWPGYTPTPLRTLPGWAKDLGIGSLLYKDEESRLGLGSFKALGGIYGVSCVLKAAEEGGPEGEERVPEGEDVTVDLLDPDRAAIHSRITVTCASAGNHGRAVARGAQMFGCKCVVFLPRSTSSHRIRAIEALGARTELVEGSFDDAVEVAAREADHQGWTVVADTTFPGYVEMPRRIMQGYTVLAQEVLNQIGGGPLPSHVFLQAGVGGLAGAVAGHLWERLGEDRPRVVIVEPAEADGLLESALRRTRTPSNGSLQTTMECLACRGVSQPAWTILEGCAEAFMTISDAAALETVALLALGHGGDPPIRTQPSGAAGLAGLVAAIFEPALASPLGLGRESRVLVIGSEGAPDGDLPSRSGGGPVSGTTALQ